MLKQLFTVCVLFSASTSFAQLGGPDGIYVPYQGLLEKDGVPIPGPVDVTFDIFNQAVGGTACGTPLLLADTVISAGQFSVLVGPLDPVCVENARVFLEITVDDGISSATLGRTEVLSSLSSVTGAAGGDFDVPGLLAAGAAEVGTLTVDNATVDGETQLLGSATVGPNPPGNFANRPGYLYVEQGAQFRCSSCGATDTFFGSSGWGNLTIQGRVLSTDANLHLSPPNGSNVVIDNAYRAAGTGTGAAPGLVVQGGVYMGTTSMQCEWTACMDTPVAGGAICGNIMPGFPIMGGIDVAIFDDQKPSGCGGNNHEDEMRLYCCRFRTGP